MRIGWERRRLIEAVAMVAFVLVVATAAQANNRGAVVVGVQLSCKRVLDPAATAESKVVRRYAPLVFFARGEKHFPMDPCSFVERSRLMWARGWRRDKQVVDLGSLSPAELGIGAIRYRLPDRSGTSYSTSQLTAPAKTSHPAHRPKGRPEGFYLDLADDARPGNVPRPGERVYSTAPALYYEFKARRYIVYWFFYGFNGAPGDGHEGDWERIVVRLDEANRATHVAYHQHGCNPHSAKTVYGVFTWKKMEREGYLAESTHPIVYSAKGAHASYPTHVGLQRTPCSYDKGMFDRTGAHLRWPTWKGDLANAAHQIWHGFGGGWGKGAKKPSAPFLDSFGWGPLGPLAFVPSVDASWL